MKTVDFILTKFKLLLEEFLREQYPFFNIYINTRDSYFFENRDKLEGLFINVSNANCQFEAENLSLKINKIIDVNLTINSFDYISVDVFYFLMTKLRLFLKSPDYYTFTKDVGVIYLYETDSFTYFTAAVSQKIAGIDTLNILNYGLKITWDDDAADFEQLEGGNLITRAQNEGKMFEENIDYSKEK